MICETNLEVLHRLENYRKLDLRVIDHCSQGKGWKGKKHGVGWARKTLMDAINEEAGSMISL